MKKYKLILCHWNKYRVRQIVASIDLWFKDMGLSDRYEYKKFLITFKTPVNHDGELHEFEFFDSTTYNTFKLLYDRADYSFAIHSEGVDIETHY